MPSRLRRAYPCDDRAHAPIGSGRMTSSSQSLVERWVGQAGRSRLAFALALVGVLVLLLAIAVFAHGLLSDRRWSLWKSALEPAVILYTLAIYPFLHRRWSRAVDALRSLAHRPELVEQARAANPNGEWAALLLGAAFSVWVTDPGHSAGRWWLLLYVTVSNIVMFGLMALAIYDSLARTWRLRRVVRSGLQLDLFDRASYAPLARWGQSVSLIFVGGTCLSLLFQSYETLNTMRSIVIYSIMVGVSLTLFFISIWSIHDALVAAQRRELAIVREHWTRARSELKTKLAEDPAGEISGLYEPIFVLGGVESQILAASTWPFNPKIVKELVATVVAPILIYVLKIAVGLSRNA
jgi:hypothetical protein